MVQLRGGTANFASDIDLLLVIKSPKTYPELHDFCEELDTRVDFTILTENSMSDPMRDASLKSEIRKDGIQVWPQ